MHGSCAPVRHPLPAEVLIKIFKLGTHSPVRDIDALSDTPPFESIHVASTAEQCAEALRTKCSLSLVSKLFRCLVQDILYEDVWIRHGSDALASALETSKDEGGRDLGLLVKRVTIIPIGYRIAGEDAPLVSLPSSTRRVLQCCRNVRVIARPKELFSLDESEPFPDDIQHLDDLEFPHLERLAWSIPLSLSIESELLQPAPNFVCSSPTLRSLYLDTDFFPVLPETHNLTIALPSLTTLSLRTLGTFGVDSIGEPTHLRLHFPALRRIIFERPEAYYNVFDGALSRLAHQLTALEFSCDALFLRHDFLSLALTTCTNVADVYVPVFTTSAPRPRLSDDSPPFAAVSSVYLHAAPLPRYANAQDVVRSYDPHDDTAKWEHLEKFIHGLVAEATRFEELRRIVLVGSEWHAYVSDARFGILQEMIRQGDVQLKVEDLMVKTILESTTA